MTLGWGASRRPLASFSLRRPHPGAATAPRLGLPARVARRGAQLLGDAPLGDDGGPLVVRRPATSPHFWPALIGPPHSRPGVVQGGYEAVTGRPADRTQNDPAPSPAAGVTT